MSFQRICEAIKFDGMSINNVAAVADIPQSSLQRFCSGQQGLQMDSLQNVCDVLGLELVRRFDADELKQYLEDGWADAKSGIEAEEFATLKSDAWDEESQDMWREYAEANDLSEGDTDEYFAWESDAYLAWSSEYDEAHYASWEAEACAEWQEAELERLQSCEWIVISE